MLKKTTVILIWILICLFSKSFGQAKECECHNEAEKSKRYSPKLSVLLTYKEFINLSSAWKITEEDYNNLYFKKFISKPSQYSESFYSLIVHSVKPIKLANSGYTINLTTCTNKDSYYEIPVYLGLHPRWPELKQFSGEIVSGKLSIEINKDIIRPKNESSDSILPILFDLDKFEFSNNETKAITSQVCLPKALISNTDIEIDFDKASIISYKDDFFNSVFNFGDYPLLLDGADEGYYNNLLIDFSGLFVKNSNLKIPIGKHQVAAKGKNIIINNHLISGIIKINYQKAKNDISIYLKNTDNNEFKITLRKLSKKLKKIGLDSFEITTLKEEKLVIIHFRG